MAIWYSIFVLFGQSPTFNFWLSPPWFSALQLLTQQLLKLQLKDSSQGRTQGGAQGV